MPRHKVGRKDSFVNTLASPAKCKSALLLSWYVLTPMAIVYGIVAMQYGVYNVLGPHGIFRDSPGGAPGQNWSHWNDEMMVPVTGREFVQGAGSTTAAQVERYGRQWYFMSPHQFCGGIMIICSIVLTSGRSQRPGPGRKWHRIAGRIYTVCHIFNLFGSLGFLLKNTFPAFPEEESTSKGGVYGGSCFTLLLWLYWLTGALSLTMGIYHICQGEVQRHRSWMSINYGTTLGAGGLRGGWVLLYLLTGENMDRTNMVSVTILTAFFLSVVPCLYTSFAHRKSLAIEKAVSSTNNRSLPWTALTLTAVATSMVVLNQSLLRFIATPDLNTVLGGANATLAAEAEAHAQSVFEGHPSGQLVFLFVGLLHAASWSTAMIAGVPLLRRSLRNPIGMDIKSPLLRIYIAAVCGIVLTTACTRFNSAMSYTAILGAHPSAIEGHFYRHLGWASWNLKICALAIKTLIFAATTGTGDKVRGVEWLLHSFGDVATYMLVFPSTWVFQRLLPTYENAFHHAFLLGGVGSALISYIVSIYIFTSEVENVSAKRFGLFALGRASAKRHASEKGKTN